MKKDDIKKIINGAHSAFDRFSIILLFGLILLVAYVGILRLISSFSETMKAVVVIGIPLAILAFMFKSFRKGSKTRPISYLFPHWIHGLDGAHKSS